MSDATLLKVGGVNALLLAVVQVVGNSLHPVLPPEAGASLVMIGHAGRWVWVHVLITVSYFIFIPFVLGFAASFRERSAWIRIGTPLVIVGAALGAAQISTHTTIFRFLGVQYAGTVDPGAQAAIAFSYDTLWPYSVALEVIHLLAIYAAVLLFGAAMLRDPGYPRWMAWLGLAAGAAATAGILVGKFVVTTAAGNLIFGFSLLPLIVWIVAVGIVLLRMQPSARVA